MNEEKIIFRIKVDVVSLKTIVQFRSCQQLNNNKRSWQCKEIELSTGNGPKELLQKVKEISCIKCGLMLENCNAYGEKIAILSRNLFLCTIIVRN